MFDDAVSETTPDSPADLLEAYESALARVIEDHGVQTVCQQTFLQRELVEGLLAGEPSPVTLSEAASILALEAGRPTADDITAEARDALLLGMSVAVLDVETVASRVSLELDPKEIQAKVEGREPMTLEEFAHLQYVVDEGKR
jgi:hypothetical protein